MARLRQTIRMNNISDLKKYCVLLERYDFCGTITAGGVSTDAHEILEIFSHSSDRRMLLSINTCLSGDIASIKTYLQKSGLTVQK